VLHHACAELRRRLLAGEDCRAEQFLAGHPSLASDPDAALAVIRAEWLARQDAGRQLPPKQWQARFPEWSDQFQSWLTANAPPHGSTASGAVTLPTGDSRTGPPTLVQSLDHHILEGQLGAGGMGVVYRAWDPILKRDVALKKIRAGLLADETQVERFYREARAAAQIHHPGVVPIFGMGLHQGEHCFTMALAPGTLEKQKKRYQADVRAAVALVEAVAHGVQAAHDKNIVHRDLKPANILLDEKGQPLVADFGLAKVCDAGAGETLPGAVQGTAAYMAPEQAAGRTWEVGKASDVWALGVILYELLTGRRPFEGEKASDVLPRVLQEDPPRPQAVQPALDRDLERIVLRCLQKSPARRYPSAAALAEDLGRWQRGVSLPRRPRPLPGLLRAMRRYPVRTLAIFLLVGAVGTAVLSLFGVEHLGRQEPQRVVGPEAVLAEYRQQLARGKPIVLLGAARGPAWSRWVTTEGATARAVRENEGFTVHHGLGLVLLELLPDVPLRSFRLRAEIRHGASTGTGRVGLFFFHGHTARPEGIAHFQCDLTFNDHTGTRPRDFGLLQRHYRGPDARGSLNDTSGPRYVPLTSPAPQPGEQARWHTVIIEVRDGGIRATFDGTQNKEWPHPHWDRDLSSLFDGRPIPAGLVPPWPQGGLGLFVSRGAASFRHVVLEPL